MSELIERKDNRRKGRSVRNPAFECPTDYVFGCSYFGLFTASSLKDRIFP